jgi:hypothetical protein
MIDERIERLMWLEIDGAISPAEHEDLRAHLEANAEARDHLETLRRMVRLFDRSGEIDPPSQLRGRILGALRSVEPPRRSGRGRLGVLDRLRAFVPPHPALRLAAAGAVGVLVGAAGYHLARLSSDTPSALDVRHLYGAMSLEGAPSESTVRVDVPGAQGIISIRRDETRVLSTLELSSEGEVEVILQYGSRPLEVTAAEIAQRSSNEVLVEAGEVRVRNRGSGSYRILYNLDTVSSSPVMVRIVSAGSVLFERGIVPARVTAKEG